MPPSAFELKTICGDFGNSRIHMNRILNATTLLRVLTVLTPRSVTGEFVVMVGAANGGGYILSSSNSIHNSVKVENFKAMIKAVRKYGKYPIR